MVGVSPLHFFDKTIHPQKKDSSVALFFVCVIYIDLQDFYFVERVWNVAK